MTPHPVPKYSPGPEEDSPLAPTILRYWPIIAALVAALLAFGKLQSDVWAVDQHVAQHEVTQKEQRTEDRERLKRIEDKLDDALGLRGGK